MRKFIDACKMSIVGVLRGFDRIVFQGKFRSLQYPEGAQQFFTDRGILFKDAKNWIQEQTCRIVQDVERISMAKTGRGITPLPSSRLRKEDVARERQREMGIDTGLIGVWSCVEECMSYHIRPAKGRPVLAPVNTRCKHLYLYFDHPTYGFMSIRLQTWMPFMVQIALNGREWLGRSLQSAGIGHERRHNKIIACDDFARAQSLLDRQVNHSNWRRILHGLVPCIFPGLNDVVGDTMTYTWYCWQSEWATDLVFTNIGAVQDRMEGVLEHALATHGSARVMRFFDKATNADCLLRKNASPAIVSRMLDFGDGMRLRHWLGGNSVKVYNQYNVVRVETTVNNPAQFKIPRRTSDKAEPRAMPMRKGVEDMTMRAKISRSDRTNSSAPAAASGKREASAVAAMAARKRV